MKKEDYTLRLDTQIVRLEQLIASLVDGVVIPSLDTAQRLLLAARLIAVHQRALAIGHTFQSENPENCKATLGSIVDGTTEPTNVANENENTKEAYDAEKEAFVHFARGNTNLFSNLEPTRVVDSTLERSDITRLDPRLDLDDIANN